METMPDEKIVSRGKEFFTSISGEAPSIFNKGWWTGKVMDWAMKNEDFKVQLFRFVDVFPYLNTSESLSRHIREYFAEGGDVPAVLKWGAGKAGIGGKLTAMLMEKTIRSNIENMGRQFIIGQNAKEAVKSIAKLRKDGFAFTVDLLGEATVNEEEADAYRDGYLEVLDALAREQDKWSPLKGPGPDTDTDWGCTPRVNVSIKPSALYSQAKPVDIEGSVQGIMKRLVPVYRKVVEMNGFLCIDMEALKYKEMTLELYRRLRSEPEFRHYPHLSIVLQAYLRESEKDLADLLHWARTEKLPIAIRLVKGAYWDAETVIAKQNGWDIPVWVHKPQSDMCFERMARTILENSDICYFACGSHNIRTIAATMETARQLGVPETRYEFQVLYGMAEPVRKGLLNVAGRVRLYCPYGELIPGMAYLVRRLLENTANESFLRQSFADGTDMERLLENPELTLQRELAARPAPVEPSGTGGIPPFRNDPMIDFTIPEQRAAFPRAIAEVRAAAGGTVPLFIGGKEVFTQDTMPTTNPADPDEKLADVCQAGIAEIDAAIEAAGRAFHIWRDVSPEDRANYLFKAADAARRSAYRLSAWQILEVGKQWDQAYHDVGEGIDFMEYYAREMLRLGRPRRMGRAPGEHNHLFYQPKGIAAVISPWNFPFAISIGMASAAIVTGNPVIYKPSGIAARIGYNLTEVFREAGLPDGVFNYCPGRSSVMGDYLVEHPAINMICFTGSMEVGLRIQEKAAVVQPGQHHCKRVIAEMGGKNAIIIDDDADLDEAVLQVIYSAFGFQGQKCSACSRVIVLDPIYDRFVKRLVEACNDLKIGPAEDPANYMGPLADASLQKNVGRYIEIAREEGTILVSRDDIPARGCYVPLTVVADITPDSRIAQEEIFGPVLGVMRASTFEEALEIANGTRFALTGGVFSRSPEHLEKARKEFRVGNLYLNKGSTGALVERQAFGGFKLSGVGSKTGGPDYLLQFMDPRVVTENTMRRGFTPIEEDDDWIV
ncbi:proline dehydrogenase family protein [Oleidesulfovibrio alaskensis]|jgi:RHH-type proline utilization regulon transcriptional repressor/proline dehydrogenase/delta 1-pyrroline-5-carboxylate dehydrogenase|uniref:proline dehydrogenase family protein n=1 Tax=Oleidesulfovibrio alaskensis TaxID=58180 RepID=UPI0004181E22|nr:proline dehydrogenase family protein [Oleidesulfovibrio alaskensis]MBL3583493.1 proline dehydrogenase family protein [Oleidesulfovibrio alaskensis]